MKHQYDWSKLDAGWSMDGDTLRYSDEDEVLYESPVSKLESTAELDCGRHHPDSLAQLAKCRVEPKPEPKPKYDWSRLDAGWKVVMQGQALLRFGRRFAVAELETCTEFPPGSDDEYRELWSQALWQLAQCRVEPAPEPSPKYNWNKLEGTGWREGNGAFITNGKFNYWYTLGDRPRLEAFDKFHPDDAVAALNSAAAAVAQCRRDWRDEVMEACRGTGLELGMSDSRLWGCVGQLLNVDDVRRMRLLSTVTFDIEKLLALSIVIERLKKLGWRES